MVKKMVNTGYSDTEIKILEAAKNVFIKQGFSGAKMQLIANEAGINKALLHYYFRSKDKLFDIIFEKELDDFFLQYSNSMTLYGSLEKTLKDRMSAAIKYFSENPVIPVFIINELNRNPYKIELIKKNIKLKAFYQKFKEHVEQEIKEKKLKKVDVQKLFTAIISLILFPVMAKNVLTAIYDMSENSFIKHAIKADVADFIIDAVKYQE
jgi:AcrR family transcriptional regulator